MAAARSAFAAFGPSAALVLACVAGCSTPGVFELNELSPAGAQKIRWKGEVYNRLLGRDLQAAIVGSRIGTPPDAPESIELSDGWQMIDVSLSGDSFYGPNGVYHIELHRFMAKGVYELEHDRVCTRLVEFEARDEKVSCAAFYRSAGGRYLGRGLTPQLEHAWPVAIEPGTFRDSKRFRDD